MKSLGHSWALYPFEHLTDGYPLPKGAIYVNSSVGLLVMIETFQRMDNGEVERQIVTRSDIPLLSDIMPL